MARTGSKTEPRQVPAPGLSLRVRGMLVLAFPVLALLAAVVAVLRLEGETRAADDMQRRATVIRAQIQQVRLVLLDAETGVLSYQLSGEARELEPLTRARGMLEAEVGTLSRLASVNREPSPRMREIERVTREQLQALAELREARGRPGAARALVARVEQNRKLLREAIDSMTADVDRLLDAAGESRKQRYQRFAFVAILCCSIGPFGGLLINLIVTNRLVRRVRQVGVNAHRLAQGQPLEDLPDGADEIAILGRELEEAAVLLRARETRLRESEQRFRQLFDQAPVPYHEAGRDGVVQSVNLAECRLLGYGSSEIVGRPAWELVAPEEREEARIELLRSMESGAEQPPREREYLLADGSRITLEIHGSLIRGPKGEVTGVRAALLDVTEHKLAELAARKVEQYAGELRSKNDQLMRAAAAARAATEAKSRFLAGMSHELRTPLNSIIGFSELMFDGKVGPVADDHREFLSDILISARHLLQLINDILDLSKIESGKFEFRPERTDISRLASEVLDVINPLAYKKRIELSLEAPPAMPAFIDPARLKQVMYNYMSNAVKFTGDGGRVTLRVLPAGDSRFRLEVEDNGIGIDPEDISRLFSEFEQLSNNRRPGQGAGLGLALTRRLVEGQGGSVGVRSAPAEGSLFWAVLPLDHEGRPAEPAPSENRLRTVLVVEDDFREAQWLCRILREAGYAAEAALNRAEAVAQCTARHFDAITLDILLPDGTGWDVLHEIRSAGLNVSTPVIVVSLTVPDGISSAFPIQDCLSKPVQPAALLNALDRAGAPPHRSRTVLVVDDDAAAARMVQAALGGLGYRAVWRPDGESGLAAIAGERPDVILLDLVMPVLDGFQFLDRLGLMPGPRPPVIVWTNKDLTAAERNRLTGGARAVMAKHDFTPKALLEQLKSVTG